MAFEPPEKGIVFWPVGNGDSTTVWIDDETVVQIDIHEVEAADEEDDARESVIDQLIDVLPKRDGEPYLAAFAATHLDNDHVKGFAELQERVMIGDLWFTPRVLEEQDEEQLSDDAKVFVEEALRRVSSLHADPEAASGDRIRIIGSADVLSEPPYSELPEESFTQTGEFFTAVDGVEHVDAFRAFVLAPEDVDAEAAQNDTSLGLQITLTDGDSTSSVLLLGDLEHESISNIFERNKAEDLVHSVFLAPHHCSKSVMYVKNAEGVEELKSDILDKIEEAMETDGHIIASCHPIPDTNESGDNPPHADARNRYQERVEAEHFIATGEYPTVDALKPIIFELGTTGFELRDERTGDAPKADVTGAVEEARGVEAPALQPTGFGRWSIV